MRYDFYRKLARILARDNEEELFQYIIHSMDDDGGFLRSRYCYWSKELPNPESGREIKTALVALRSPFNFMSSTKYYEEAEVKDGTSTILKMQVFYFDLSKEESFIDETKWSAGVGFPYPIKVDMVNETFEILDRVRLF